MRWQILVVAQAVYPNVREATLRQIPALRVRPRGGLGITCSIFLRRSFRNKLSNQMAFPHPKPRKNHYRNEEKPSRVGVLGNFVKRTVNITDDRNAKENVNPAKNRTLRGTADHFIPPMRICCTHGPNERVHLL